GLCDGLEGRRAGERLPENRGDAIEAALHPRLARAARERLGIAEGERRETGEGVEHVGIARTERPAVPPAYAQHSLHVVAPAHRSHDRVGKAAIGLVRNRVRELAVLAADERPALPEGEAGEAAHGRELEPAERGVEA